MSGAEIGSCCFQIRTGASLPNNCVILRTLPVTIVAETW